MNVNKNIGKACVVKIGFDSQKINGRLKQLIVMVSAVPMLLNGNVVEACSSQNLFDSIHKKRSLRSE
jgi:hypothetical protein